MTTQEHIVAYKDILTDGSQQILLMELLPLGDLGQANATRMLSLNEVTEVLRQVLKALRYLHDEKGITHRDIKPSNILLASRDPHIFVKLCDFGISSDRTILQTHVGTRLYQAPEVEAPPYDKLADIWSIAVVAVQYIYGLPPYRNRIEAEAYDQQLKYFVEWSLFFDLSPLAFLLYRMLQVNLRDRPSAAACLSDPAFEDLLPPTSPPQPGSSDVAARRCDSALGTLISPLSPPVQSSNPTSAAAGLLMLWEQPGKIAGGLLQQTEEARTEILSMYNPVRTQKPTNLQHFYHDLRSPGQNSQARSEPLLKASSSGTQLIRPIAWKSLEGTSCKAAATTIATTPGEASCEKTVIQTVTTASSSRKRALEPLDGDDEGKERTIIRRTIELSDDDDEDEGKHRTAIRRAIEPKK